MVHTIVPGRVLSGITTGARRCFLGTCPPLNVANRLVVRAREAAMKTLNVCRESPSVVVCAE
jgi:hypothetical protein